MATAKSRWQKLTAKRSAVLERAREASKLTIPGLIPEEGASDNTHYDTPYQSLGARGVNNLSSRLLLSLLPPETSFFNLRIDEDVAAALGDSQADAQEQMARIERKANTRVEGSNARPVLAEVLRHLAVAGNGLLYFPRSVNLQFFRLDQYVIRRAPDGSPREIVVKEQVYPDTLSPKVRQAVNLSDKDKESEKKRVDVYTWIRWVNGRVKYHQEINDKRVPDSNGSHPEATTPWIPLRWTALPNEDYGRSLVMEYNGDLLSLEELSKAIVKFASATSKIIFMERPGSTTDIDSLNKAESGDWVAGDPDDVAVFQIEKFADFRVASETADKLELRLSHAFLLRSGTIRDAERVTAEEIRATAQELEDVLGGVYTVLSREFQLPFVRRLLKIMQDDRSIPRLPNDAVSPIIVTGFEALGRNHSTNRLRAMMIDAREILGDQLVASYVNVAEVLKRLGTGHGVEGLDDLLKSEDQVASENETAALQTAASAAAPGVALEATKAAVQSQ